MNYADLELSGGTKGSGKSGTTSKVVKRPPVDTTRVSYSEVEHSGTTAGSKGVIETTCGSSCLCNHLITIKQVMLPPSHSTHICKSLLGITTVQTPNQLVG